MADPDIGSLSPEEDQDFDPSAEMMVHDYDDEQTLDEEEAMSNEDSMGNELDDLQKESEIPMEELLAMYGYNKDKMHSKKTDATITDQSATSMEEEMKKEKERDNQENGEVESAVDNAGINAEGSFSTTDFLCSDLMDAGSDDDEDYDPDQDHEDWKKSVPIGPDHQANVSECPAVFDDVSDYEKDDGILWSPQNLDEVDVADYLREVHELNQTKSQVMTTMTNNPMTRDDEQALHLLLQCNNNFEEALKRHKSQCNPPTDPMSLWTEDECRNFETGLRLYGKDFFLNQQNKVKSRSVREIVQFYYLWKKSERHDSFAARTRMEKKKYALHPGITDYMDRFIYEFENPLMEAQSGNTMCNLPSATSLPFPHSSMLNHELENIPTFCNNSNMSDDSRNVSHLVHDSHASDPYSSSICYDFSVTTSSFHLPPTCGVSSFVPHQQRNDLHRNNLNIQSDSTPTSTQCFGASNCGTFPPSNTFYNSSLDSRSTNECSLMDVDGLIASSNINTTDEPQELTITDINMIFGNVEKSSAGGMIENIGSSGDFGKYVADQTLPESMQKLCSDDGIEPTLESISASIQEFVDPDAENILSVLDVAPCCSSGNHVDNGLMLSIAGGSEHGYFNLDNLIVKEHVAMVTGDGGCNSDAANHQVEGQMNLSARSDLDPNGCTNATVIS